VFGEKVLEKNCDRISIRVPSRWKSELAARKIQIAPYVRSVIFNLLQTSDEVLKNRPVLKSKVQAGVIYNSLNEFFVRTKSGGFDEKIKGSSFKTPVFRAEFLSLPNSRGSFHMRNTPKKFCRSITNES